MQNNNMKLIRLEQSKMLQAFEKIKAKKGIKKNNAKFLMKSQEMLMR